MILADQVLLCCEHTVSADNISVFAFKFRKNNGAKTATSESSQINNNPAPNQV